MPEHQKEVLEAMGITLLLLQTTEKTIRLCMTFVFQKNSPLTFDLLQEQKDAERTKTIGYFLTELRKRVSVDESFDALLKEFLKNRNDFIHDLSRVPNWDFDSSDKPTEALRFIHKLIQQTESVLKAFTGLVMAWQEQSGITDTAPPAHEWFDEVAQTYKPLADHLFYAKDT